MRTFIYDKENTMPFTDRLTGLFHHSFFEITLAREIQGAQRHGMPFTLALIDIDFFPELKNRHGHVWGERILQQVASVIKANIRQGDLVARYSSDVFGLILINSETYSARAALERIRQAVAQRFNDVPTVSAGFASFPADGTDKESLFKAALDALFQAKNLGKNRVHFFEKEPPCIDTEKSRILVVDDEPRNVKLIRALLLSLNYEVITAFSGEGALAVIEKAEVDLVLLDIMMPGMDGYEVCRRLKSAASTRLIPVVLVTALEDTTSKVKGIEAGADDFLTKPVNKVELLARAKSLIKVRKLNSSLVSIENVLFSLANAVEAKDSYTQGHIKRVANVAVTLGEKMGLEERKIEALRLGAALHDIGKIGVPGNILNKPGPLNAEEWEIMKAHPDLGHRICLPLKKNLGSALKVIRHHHEMLDGTGYPDGLKGNEISMVARIMVVSDIYDALITDRPYRKRMSKEKALGILRQMVFEGKLDKQVVENLTEMVSR